MVDLPGILAGVAAVLTALGALWVAIRNTRTPEKRVEPNGVPEVPRRAADLEARAADLLNTMIDNLQEELDR